MASNSADSNWRPEKNANIEPFKMIISNPATPIPNNKINPTPIEEERMKKIKKISTPANCHEFWDNIYSGGVGTNDPNMLSPHFEEIIGMTISILLRFLTIMHSPM